MAKRGLLSLVKLVSVLAMLISTCFLPLIAIAAVCALTIALLCMKGRELLSKSLKTASIFASTYLVMSLIVYLGVGSELRQALAMSMPVAARLFTMCIASFLIPCIVSIPEALSFFRSASLRFIFSTSMYILRSLPKFSEVKRVVELNYGCRNPVAGIKLLAVVVIDKSIECVEQLCLRMPDVCLGGPTHRFIQPHSRSSAVPKLRNSVAH